ncbi:Bromodomain-containing protein [Trichodelitschia bisporula]|uniref:Bromodomain-containing protein n=1 Tax=Trichodelitschia bisporula TaxID=703511 RepID=A0A6G1I6R3_9PEZI|nr:Bromodomain-containing protein [Trichodelitschia bisporula]
MADSKRKASVLGDSDHRTGKRQKLSAMPSKETPESTTELGLKFIENIRNTKDKTGRLIATLFLTLPDPEKHPGYYEEIKLPIALDTMEAKLRAGEYLTITALESDLKRMVANAKNFNDKRSDLYQDAERVRKTASNWMTRHNPAYLDPTYVAVATPLPDVPQGPPKIAVAPKKVPKAKENSPVRNAAETSVLENQQTEESAGAGAAVEADDVADIEADANGHGSDEDAQGDDDLAQEPSREQSTQGQNNGHTDSEVPTSAEVNETSQNTVSFAGMTFQQAQDALLEALLHYKDDEGYEIFGPFANYPPRSLRDYYEVIKYPVSLKGILKKIRGIQGRKESTGITCFKTWDELYAEVSFIWSNAREYNEDGSPLFELAGEFETVFLRLLKEAKKHAPGPPQPSLKLKVSAPKPQAPPPKQSLKIKLGGAVTERSSSATPVRDTTTPGVIVHSEALSRQQQMVAAGMSGRVPSGMRNSPSVPTLQPRVSSGRSVSAAPLPAQTNGVKKEAAPIASPSLQDTTPMTGIVLNPTRMVMPGTAPAHNTSPMVTSLPSHPSHPVQPPQPQNQNDVLGQPKWRDVIEGEPEYVMPDVTVTTHPSLNLSKPSTWVVKASASYTHQSEGTHFPAAWNFVQIVPRIPAAATDRSYRMWMFVNGHRVMESAQPGVRDKTRPLFDVHLERGFTNRIEIEAVAQSAHGDNKVNQEKFLLFIYVAPF